ncbi:MAG: LPXTG cell wall anchor domain-containing protein, partial [Frankiales bacterium]|nr:LPXTG cell wall anchor domain-containing protein [Frankiales bacterium]
TVNSALAQVTALLADTLGLQVPNQARTSKSATADEASATVDAASLVLDPLRNAAAPLLRIGFVPATAKVSARSITNTVITPTASATSLPRTGGSIPLALAGTVLLGVALAARRRRSATV